MLFKKEFDIDKDFFTEKPRRTPKRKVALRVFSGVLLVTLVLLCYSACTFNFNLKFGHKSEDLQNKSLKQASEYFFEAVKLYDSGEYDKALEYLKKQLEIVDDCDAYNYLAKIYLEKEDKELAIENFKKALEFKPDMFEANFELGKIYFAENDFKNAAKYLTESCSVQIDNVEALSLTADAYKMIGKSDDAIILLQKVLSINPDSAFANAKIGEIYFHKLQHADAIPYFEDALSISFDSNSAMMLAKAYFELNNLEKARALTEEILQDDKNNSQAQSLKKAIEYKFSNKKSSIEQKAKNDAINKINSEKLDQNALSEYIREIELPIKMNWTPPAGSNLKKASVKFTVNKEGELLSSVIFMSSGMGEFDKSALDAIELSKPFPPLPSQLNKDELDIIFTFDFNIKN